MSPEEENHKVEDKPVVEGKTSFAGMEFAPEGFGAYVGQLFVAEAGSFQAPVPMTQPVPADGKVHRVTPEGQLQLVATGFVTPLGVRFIGKKLWVADVNGDFILGKRELPEGFIVEITAQ
jgi:glucose/arabinose dehydrogenase